MDNRAYFALYPGGTSSLEQTTVPLAAHSSRTINTYTLNKYFYKAHSNNCRLAQPVRLCEIAKEFRQNRSITQLGDLTIVAAEIAVRVQLETQVATIPQTEEQEARAQISCITRINRFKSIIFFCLLGAIV